MTHRHIYLSVHLLELVIPATLQKTKGASYSKAIGFSKISSSFIDTQQELQHSLIDLSFSLF